MTKCDYCEAPATHRLDLDTYTENPRRLPSRGWVAWHCQDHQQIADSEAVKYMDQHEDVTTANTKISRTQLAYKSVVCNALLPNEVEKLQAENTAPPVVWALNDPKELKAVADLIFPQLQDRLVQLLEHNSPPCAKCRLERKEKPTNDNS